MKKNKKCILSIISAVSGVFAICGLLCLGLFSKPKVQQKVEAASTTLALYQNGFNVEMPFVKEVNNAHTTMYYDGTFKYFKQYVNGVLNYYYQFTFTSYFDFFVDGNAYRYNVVDISVGDSSVLEEVTLFSTPSTTQTNHIGFYFENYQNRSVPDTTLVMSCSVDEINYEIFNTSNRIVPLDSANTLPSGYTINYFLSQINDRGFNVNNHYEIFQRSFTPVSTDSYDNGYLDGYADGYSQGYEQGLNIGYNNGYTQGKNDGYNEASQQFTTYYNQGYSDGYNAADMGDATVSAIFSGILQVAFVPINFFLSIFNFEILGVNLSAFIRAIFTIAITIIVIKTFTGKGGGE